MTHTIINVGGYHVRPWPEIMTNHAQTRTHCMSEADPLPIYHFLRGSTEQGRKFLREIPPEVINAVNQYTNCKLPLYYLAGANPKLFVRLVYQSPALVYAAAALSWSRQDPVSLINKQCDLWAHMGYTGSRSFARQVAKIPPHLLMPNAIDVLDIRWRNNRLFRRIWCHQSHINFGSFMVSLYLSDDFIRPWVFKLCIENPEHTSHIFFQLGNLARAFRQLNPNQPMVFDDLESVEALDRALARLDRKITKDIEDYLVTYTAPFPNPPFPSDSGHKIQPIRHPFQLYNESSEAQNCVLLYTNQIYAGLAYIYKCSNPRLTILVEREPRGRWKLSQVESPENCPATDRAMDFVKNWFQKVSS